MHYPSYVPSLCFPWQWRTHPSHWQWLGKEHGQPLPYHTVWWGFHQDQWLPLARKADSQLQWDAIIKQNVTLSPPPCFLCGLQLNTTGQGQHVTLSSVQIVAPDISWWHFLAGRCCHQLRGESLDKQVSEDSTDTHWTQWLTNWSQWTHWEGGESPPISLVNVKRSIWWTSRTPHYGLNGWRIWSFMLRKWLWLPCLNQQCMVLDLQ